MPRYATVAPHLAVGELEIRYRTCRDAVERTHWHLLWLVASGHRVPDVAALLGYTANWVRTIIRRYNAAGPAGITDRRHANPGAIPLLTPDLRAELRATLAAPPPDGGLWTSRKVATWMAARLGRPVSPQRGWEALRTLGFSAQQPRPRTTTADPAAQERFKKGGSPRRSPPSRPPIPPQR